MIPADSKSLTGLGQKMTDNAYTRRYLTDPQEADADQKEPVEKSVDDVEKEDD